MVRKGPPPIDVMLADGNPLILSAMSEVFEASPRFSLVATSATAEGFLGAVMRVPVQIGVIDWNLPVLGGEKLIEVLREQENAPRIVVFGDDQPAVPRAAMGAGAAAFVPRSAPAETILQTCIDVAAGKMVFPYLDVRGLKDDPMETLSRKERMILGELAKGLTNRELSKVLEISPNTVKFHLSNVFDKLGVRNRAQAIAFYYRARGEADAS